MSAVSQSSTLRFFGALKNLFSKPSINAAPKTPAVTPITPVKPAGALRNNAAAAAREHTNGHATNGKGESKGECISLPLQTVILAMSPELRGKVRAAVSDDLKVSIPVDNILPQLGKGSVKISFGDVRRAAPQVFAIGVDHDHLPVVLPLAEIMSRMNPALMPRRNNGQKHQPRLSEDIISPFDLGGQGLKIADAKSQTAAPPPQSIPKRVPPFGATPPAPRSVTPLPVSGNTSRFARVPAISVPPLTQPPAITPVAPAAATITPAPTPTPARTAKPSTTFAFAPITPIAPDTTDDKTESKPIPMPAATPNLTTAPRQLQTVGDDSSPAMPLKPAPVPTIPSGPPLTLPVSTLIQEWPETLRQEVVKMNLAGSQLALPADLVDAGLKRGRVAFPWKQLRSWLTPSAPPAESVHDEIEVLLPLKVVAPLFLTRKNAIAAAAKAVKVDESIPNLFFGFPQPDASAPATKHHGAPVTSAPAAAVPEPIAFAPVNAPASAPVAAAQPVDTNYYVFADDNDTSFVEQPAPIKRSPATSGTGTEFATRYATPNEIVSRAAGLDGVAGALIALPDGLSVASKVPDNLNSDTLAAFLPQLFSKMTQCTKELRMGELNNLNFTVGNVPWKVFRVNAVFFAAFGSAANPLPTAQLAALAAELDHKNKKQ